jgi:hypothetical protein
MEELYNLLNRLKKFKSTNTSIIDRKVSFFVLPIQSENFFTKLELLNFKDYRIITRVLGSDFFEEVFENYKYTKMNQNLNILNSLSTDINFITPISYTQVIDTFRPDYDELS